jgi:recombinational DNA repair protein RecR
MARERKGFHCGKKTRWRAVPVRKGDIKKKKKLVKKCPKCGSPTEEDYCEGCGMPVSKCTCG